jgi:AcrR family transcriptional regulator
MRHAKHAKPTSRLASARERIDRAAYELFSRHGVRGVGVDTVCARSGVAKMTLYKHYPSKEDLVLAFLRRREDLWTRAWLQHEVEHRAGAPAERLLAVFDAFGKWFRRSDYEACAFVKVLLEHDEPAHPVRKSAQGHLQTIHDFLRRLAAEARVADPARFARQWQILMLGSIIAAYAGDRDAARRAKELGGLLLARAGLRTRGHARA